MDHRVTQSPREFHDRARTIIDRARTITPRADSVKRYTFVALTPLDNCGTMLARSAGHGFFHRVKGHLAQAVGAAFFRDKFGVTRQT